jgi:hypothetical protein
MPPPIPSPSFPTGPGPAPPAHDDDRSERKLTGRWVTSYSGFMHFDPPQPLAAAGMPLPPQLACVGYKPTTNTTGTYSPREGYFLVAAVAFFIFRKDGSLVGSTYINRGGSAFLENRMTGHYVQVLTDMDVRSGVITTHHTNTGNLDVENTYNFIMKSKDEIEWVLAGSSYRGVVAHGTMTRISYP